MRRQNSGDISSFDLLLDTMCNTFGGIVFIALLLSILVGSTSRNTAKPAQHEGPSLSEIEAFAEENRLLLECSQLQIAIQALEPVNVPDTIRASTTAQSLSELQEANVNMTEKIAQLTHQQQLLEREISELGESAKNLSVSARDIQEQILRLNEELRQQRARSTLKVRLPRVRSRPGMQACFFAIAGGRFYSVSDVGQAYTYSDRGYDLQDVAVESGEGQDIAEVLKGAGQSIHPGAENIGKLALALKNCDKNNEIISFSVRRDSFAEFNYVKQLFVSHGFSYNWHITDGAIQIVVVTDALEAQ